MVYYDYTNNSSSASSAMVDVSLKAFQHGESCEAAIPRIMTMRSIILQLRFSPDRPLMYARHFTLTDESDVTVQAQEAFSFDEDAIA